MKVSPLHNQWKQERIVSKALVAQHNEQEKRLTGMSYKYLPYDLIEAGATINLSECEFESERPYGRGIYFRRKHRG